MPHREHKTFSCSKISEFFSVIPSPLWKICWQEGTEHLRKGNILISLHDLKIYKVITVNVWLSPLHPKFWLSRLPAHVPPHMNTTCRWKRVIIYPSSYTQLINSKILLVLDTKYLAKTFSIECYLGWPNQHINSQNKAVDSKNTQPSVA